MTGSEQVLIEDWCQQYPRHSTGSLSFGADGALYVSGGDGASFNFADYGQAGGSAGSPTLKNPCGDPPGGAGDSARSPGEIGHIGHIGHQATMVGAIRTAGVRFGTTPGVDRFCSAAAIRIVAGMPITTGFNHVATLTTDLDRFAAFYGEVFGAEVVFRMEAAGDHPKMYILDMGGESTPPVARPHDVEEAWGALAPVIAALRAPIVASLASETAKADFPVPATRARR